MNKLSFLALAVALVALGVSLSPQTQNAQQETAYERVIKSQTLRCGYVIDPPHVVKDPNSGAVSGIIVDTVNEAGRLLQIKVEWAEEVGWGTSVEALRSGKVDAVCTDYWMEPLEGRYVGYSMPLYYSAVSPFVRADDSRFDKDIKAIDDPSVTISTTDGEIPAYIAQTDFPKAKLLSMPNMTDISQNLLNVATKKADVTFVDVVIGKRFEKTNPGKLKRLAPERPLFVFPVTILLPQNDLALKTTLDSAFTQILNSGFIDKTLTKYGFPPDVVFRATQPYADPQKLR